MRPGKRLGLSAMEKSEIWRPWKVGSRCMRREISRHGGRPADRAHIADHHAWDSALRPKKFPLEKRRIDGGNRAKIQA
jgi:hypothetical protein